jgi:hypothetical protein
MYPAPWTTRYLVHAPSSPPPPPSPLIYGFDQLCTNIQNISNSSHDKYANVDHEKVSARPVTEYTYCRNSVNARDSLKVRVGWWTVHWLYTCRSRNQIPILLLTLIDYITFLQVQRMQILGRVWYSAMRANIPKMPALIPVLISRIISWLSD